MTAPAAPGGGWDQTARALQQALQTEGLVRSVVGRERHRGRRHDWPRALHRRRARAPGRPDGLGAHHARRRGDARVADHAGRRDAHRAADRRIRSDRGARWFPAPIARRSRRRPQGRSGIDLVGRRVRGGQRPDAGRTGRRGRRRLAAARQLHRVLGRRRVAGRDRRRAGVGRRQRARGARGPDPGGHRSRAGDLQRVPPARARRAHAARAGRARGVRELALRGRRRPGCPPASARGSRNWSRRWSARRAGPACWRGTAGSIAFCRRATSRGSRPRRNSACAACWRNSAPASRPTPATDRAPGAYPWAILLAIGVSAAGSWFTARRRPRASSDAARAWHAAAAAGVDRRRAGRERGGARVAGHGAVVGRAVLGCRARLRSRASVARCRLRACWWRGLAFQLFDRVLGVPLPGGILSGVL